MGMPERKEEAKDIWDGTKVEEKDMGERGVTQE